MQLYEKVDFLFELLQSTMPISCWHYDHDMRLINTNSPKSETLDHFFELEMCKEKVQKHCQDSHLPILISNHLFLSWLCVSVKINDVLTDIYVLGPVFLGSVPEANITKALDRLQLSVSLHSSMKDTLKHIPSINMETLLMFGQQLYYCLNQTRIRSADIRVLSISHRDIYVMSSDDSLQAQLKSYQEERSLLSAVAKGNIHYNMQFQSHPFFSIGGICSPDPLRQAKDEMIALVTLLCRSAISGGLLPETAYALSAFYITSIEKAASISYAYKRGNDAYKDLVFRVNALKLASHSREVVMCCEYIITHLSKKISLASIAEELGYNKNYLAMRFKKETGLTVGNYIAEHRIDNAKKLLLSTTLSIADIAQQCGFNTESHFSHIFRKKINMTPSEYRREPQKAQKTILETMQESTIDNYSRQFSRQSNSL